MPSGEIGEENFDRGRPLIPSDLEIELKAERAPKTARQSKYQTSRQTFYSLKEAQMVLDKCVLGQTSDIDKNLMC